MISCCSCPCCQQGQVGYRLCANRETVVLLCEECAMVWLHPNKVSLEQARDPLASDFGRQNPSVDLRGSNWATSEQVEAWGWGPYLLRPQDLLENS